MPANYDFLKPLFGENAAAALTFDQFSAALEGNKEIKIGNLSGGEYVAKGKYDAIVAERDTLKEAKAAADEKLAGYDPEWKTKSERAQQAADKRVAEILLKSATVEKLRGAGCKDPELVYGTLDLERLKVDGDAVLGLTEQIEASRKARPFLYDSGDGGVTVTTGTNSRKGGGAAGAVQGYLDDFYKNNPFYKPKK